MNRVYGLKIIWRMLIGDSLWGRWIKSNLLKKKCFWEVKDDTQAGFWMWRKIIKIRDIVKNFYKKEVGNGCNTSFWYDNWSSEGVLVDTLGTRGPIVLGIRNEATVAETAIGVRRTRRHRNEVFNAIAMELEPVKERVSGAVEDLSLWRCNAGFKSEFSSQET